MGKQMNYIALSLEKHFPIVMKLPYSDMEKKRQLYTLVVDETEAPRPTVRRVARDMKLEYKKRLSIMESE